MPHSGTPGIILAAKIISNCFVIVYTSDCILSVKPNNLLIDYNDLPLLNAIFDEVIFGIVVSYQNQGKIHGIAATRNAPPISHLFFADKNMVFVGQITK